MTTLFDAEVYTVPLKVPERRELYLVLACMADGTWTVPSALRSCGGLWLTPEAAHKAADELSGVWLHKRIVRIPGEKHGQ